VTLELNNKSLEKEVQGNEPLLRDCIIGLLNSETSNDIMVNRTKLKQDAMSLLNKNLSTGEVTNIYFSDLIMQ
jgi:flagellar FliL protein